MKLLLLLDFCRDAEDKLATSAALSRGVREAHTPLSGHEMPELDNVGDGLSIFPARSTAKNYRLRHSPFSQASSTFLAAA